MMGAPHTKGRCWPDAPVRVPKALWEPLPAPDLPSTFAQKFATHNRCTLVLAIIEAILYIINIAMSPRDPWPQLHG